MVTVNTGVKKILSHQAKSFCFKAKGWKLKTKQKAD